MNKETRNERGIAAFRWDMTVPEFKMENGVNKLVDKKKTYFLAYDYPKEELDYGNYWDFNDNEESFYLKDDNGNYILDDACQIMEWNEICSEVNIESKIDDLQKPFDYFEINYTRRYDKCIICTLRVTALPERPHICADKCEDNGIGYLAANRIRIYGKPLRDDGIFTDNNHLWKKDLKEIVLEAVKSRLFGDSEVDFQMDEKSIMISEKSFTVKAKAVAPSENALRSVMERIAGKSVPEDCIKCNLITGNSDSGERKVYADIVISSYPYC